MRLKNKKTGEIDEFLFEVIKDRIDLYRRVEHSETKNIWHYDSLAELNEEWEDYEEPKEYWFIDEFGLVQKEIEYYYEENKEAVHDKRIAVGNYFETREEAEEAVEKLKAWKRLKDKGMIKYSFHKEKPGIDLDFYTLTILAPRDKDSLDLLFGSEE